MFVAILYSHINIKFLEHSRINMKVFIHSYFDIKLFLYFHINVKHFALLDYTSLLTHRSIFREGTAKFHMTY